MPLSKYMIKRSTSTENHLGKKYWSGLPYSAGTNATYKCHNSTTGCSFQHMLTF